MQQNETRHSVPASSRADFSAALVESCQSLTSKLRPLDFNTLEGYVFPFLLKSRKLSQVLACLEEMYLQNAYLFFFKIVSPLNGILMESNSDELTGMEGQQCFSDKKNP